jgi:hypothetical protein
MSKEPNPEITVNDRRMFNPDGTLRQPLPEEVSEPTPPPAPESARQESKQDTKQDKKKEKEKEKEKESSRSAKERPTGMSADFSNLVGMLTTNAILHLGIDPQFGRGNIDLETARHFIDMLTVLQEKTEGNLSDEESRMLTDMISRLRMEYVTVANQLSASAKSTKK